jgi:hypothetical protein
VPGPTRTGARNPSVVLRRIWLIAAVLVMTVVGDEVDTCIGTHDDEEWR